MSTGKSNYEPLIGYVARERLNALGYPVKGTDEKDRAILGVLVAMAEEIKSLYTLVAELKQPKA